LKREAPRLIASQARKTAMITILQCHHLTNEKQTGDIRMNEIYGVGGVAGGTLGTSFSNSKQNYQTSSGKNVISN
jgi:hypothetical protein